MVERNSFDNDLRSRFEEFAPEPPAGVWLAVQEAIVVAPPQRRLIPMFFRVAAAIAFLAVSGISVWFIADKQQSGTLADSGITIPSSDNAAESNHNANISSSPATESARVPSNSQTDLAASELRQIHPAHNESSPHNEIFAATAPRKSGVVTDDAPSTMASGNNTFEQQAFALQYASISSIGHTALPNRQNRSVSPRQNIIPGNNRIGGSLAWNTASETRRMARNDARPGIVFGLHVSPQYNDRHIVPGSQSPSGMAFGALEKQSVSYGYGASVSIPINSRLEVQTGLSFKNLDQQVNDISAFSRADQQPFYDIAFAPGNGHPQNIMTSFGTIKTNQPGLYFSDIQSSRVNIPDSKLPFDVPDDPKLLSLEGQALVQSFSFLEIPLVFRYKLLDYRHFGLDLKAGIAGNYLIRNDVIMSYMNNTSEVIGETYGLREFSLSGIGGLAFTLPLTNHVSLFVEPTAQMFMQPIANEAATANAGKTFPYCFAVYSGISFRF